MAKFFIKIITKELPKSSAINADGISELLYKAFNETKKEMKIGKASFLAICSFTGTPPTFCLHSGDVRLGHFFEGTPIEWITNVHTGANPLGDFFTTDMLKNNKKQILTRCFNLQRQLKLELSELPKTHGKMVVATDGFWAESTLDMQGSILRGEQCQNNDDVSVLMLDWVGTLDGLPNNTEENLIVSTS
ncbi:hypothetical protein [Aliivibrio logei]|uniref:hypothetical protein n=1 Tax=Aliivibrio logei TaxID=688 RepID=UPI0035C92626